MKRLVFPFLAAGLAALALPWSSASAGAEPAFSGYNSSAWAAPVKIEFYEPTIPIPADPQFEVELGYSRVEAETGLGRGRGSWLWPGDPVGEGAKTFVEQLGLPKELGERGYPVQVNSTYPTGPEQQNDEPFPGTIMRTSADAQQVVAQVGASPDGQAQEPGADDGDGGGAPETPGLPEVPGLPIADLTDFGAAITGAAEEPEPGPSGAPGMPEELAALVDFTGYTSTSSAQTGTDLVRTASRSALGDVSLVGGLITVEAVHTRLATRQRRQQGQRQGRRRRRHPAHRRQRVHDRPRRYRGCRTAGADPGAARRPGEGPCRARHPARGAQARARAQRRRRHRTGAGAPGRDRHRPTARQARPAAAGRHHRRDPERRPGAQEPAQRGHRAVAADRADPRQLRDRDRHGAGDRDPGPARRTRCRSRRRRRHRNGRRRGQRRGPAAERPRRTGRHRAPPRPPTATSPARRRWARDCRRSPASPGR